MDKMIMKYLFVGFLNAFILFGTVDAKSCKRKSSCSCECSQGIVDLKALGTTDGPRYKDVTGLDRLFYSYNPCDPFSQTYPGAVAEFCNDVAACQIIGQSGVVQFYDAGKQDSVTFYTENANDVGLEIDADVVVAKYTSGDAERQTEVVLVCNDQDSTTTFDAIGEIIYSPATYRFILVSPECCFTSVSGLGVGSVLLIVAFSMLGVYLIVGVIVKKLVYKESGKELIPNTSFWFALPSLIKEGCVCIFKRGNYSKM